MNCLIEFLMDGYQKKLIGMIQNREETFQEALDSYKKLYVPFNKRYSIRNEHFSLTGQPVLYLGNSIADLIEELNVDCEDETKLKNFRVAFLNLIIPILEYGNNCLEEG